MKKLLNLLALAIVLAAVVTWAVTGGNRGWTKTSVKVETLDPVTGIEGITYQPKFLPGVDFLGAAAVLSIGLTGSALLIRSKSKTTSTNKQDINH
jgi:hypothetical protein